MKMISINDPQLFNAPHYSQICIVAIIFAVLKQRI